MSNEGERIAGQGWAKPQRRTHICEGRGTPPWRGEREAKGKGEEKEGGMLRRG